MKSIAFGQDGSFSWEDLSARYQSDLANGFGNLASRVIAMINKYFDGVIPLATEFTDADLEIQNMAAAAIRDAESAIESVAIHEAISSIWTLVDALNTYITVQEPWVLAKSESNRDRLATVLNTTAEGLRVLAAALNPIMPKACAKLWAALTSGNLGELQDQPLADVATWNQIPEGTKVSELEALFPRVENLDEGK
jgi:methionyl-tRNA synthetase